MTRRASRSANPARPSHAPEADNSRAGGRWVAARALSQIRLIAVVLLLVGAAGYRPTASSPVSRALALPLAGAAAAVLLVVALITVAATRAGTRSRSRLALVATAADTTVVLGVVWLAGLPPQSFSLILLMLPLLEAALWFGLRGLAVTWTVSSVALGTLVLLLPQRAPHDALSTLVVAMPTLLLATIPVALLAEHLVAQVGRLGEARRTADERAQILGDLSTLTAEIYALDADAVLEQLVTGATQLGAAGATVLDPAAGRHSSPVLAAAGDVAAVTAAGTVAPSGNGEVEDAAPAPTGPGMAAVSRKINVPGGAPYVFAAVIDGSAEEISRRGEAIDLLVAQARVGLAHAVLVEQLEQLKQTYQDQATRDQLTGLLNRRGLVARAEQLTGRLGVLFCDLDGFKGVNDTLGHSAGDELLEQVARRLESEVRSGGVLGRIGGDEFVLVVPDVSDDELAGIAARIETHLSRPFLLASGMAHIGVSIGSAHAESGENDLEAVLDMADHLMYQVKRGRAADRSASLTAGLAA